MLHVWGVRVWNGNLAMEEEILHEGSMSGAVIYISEFQNKLPWKFGISVSHSLRESIPLVPLIDTILCGDRYH